MKKWKWRREISNKKSYAISHSIQILYHSFQAPSTRYNTICIQKVTKLLLCFFKENTLLESGVELHKLDFALYALLILTGPDDMLGLRRFKANEFIL